LNKKYPEGYLFKLLKEDKLLETDVSRLTEQDANILVHALLMKMIIDSFIISYNKIEKDRRVMKK